MQGYLRTVQNVEPLGAFHGALRAEGRYPANGPAALQIHHDAQATMLLHLLIAEQAAHPVLF